MNMNTGNVDEVARQAKLPKPVVLAFAHLDPQALGIACGLVAGLLIYLATAIPLLRGGAEVGPNLYLLSQYFIGYRITWAGAAVGFAYACFAGFIFGYAFAVFRNALIHTYLFFLHRKAKEEAYSDLP